jgi:prepilin-type N-terminal cleavage/methylation domain-containing protein
VYKLLRKYYIIYINNWKEVYMKNKNIRRKGFTLIELLVVVLIIGILAVIALPQYKKAIERTEAMKILPTLKALQGAIQRCILITGANVSKNNCTPEELDINLYDKNGQLMNSALIKKVNNGGWINDRFYLSFRDTYYEIVRGPYAGTYYFVWQIGSNGDCSLITNGSHPRGIDLVMSLGLLKTRPTASGWIYHPVGTCYPA